MVRSVSRKQKPPDTQVNLRRLSRFNGWLAAVYAVQGIFVLLLSATRLFPMEVSYVTKDAIAAEIAGHPVTALATRHVGDINLAYLLAAVFFVAAATHAVTATVGRPLYEPGLKKRTNGFRSVEFGLTSGILLSAIAMLAGARDLVALGMLFFVAGLGSLALFAAELSAGRPAGPVKEQSARLLAGVSTAAGAVLWLGLFAYLWTSGVYSTDGLPGFMYGLAGSALALLLLYGATTYLSWRKIGRWADYIFAEYTYMVLGLVIKTVLVWQIFAGVLRT